MSKQALATNDNYTKDASRLVGGLTLPSNLRQGSRYSNAQRLQAVSLYFVTGKLSDVSDFIGVPQSTLRGWRAKDWWVDVLVKLRHDNADFFESKSRKIIDLAFKNTEKRLVKGDAYVDKNQQVKYKPMSGKESTMVMAITYDKLRISLALPTSISQSTTTHLIDIQAQFNNMSKGKLIEHDK